MNITVNAAAIKEASQKLSNWGKWGKDDQIGTLNHVTPEDIVRASTHYYNTGEELDRLVAVVQRLSAS